MKLLDLCEFWSERGGGVRSYLGRMATAGAALGHEIVIVAPGPRDEETRVDGARLVRFRGPTMPYDPTYHAPLRVDAMRSIIREERPDVLQASSPFVPAWVTAVCREVPLRTYVHHADPIGCYLAPRVAAWPEPARRAALAGAWRALRAACSGVDLTVVAGDWLREQLRSRGFHDVHTVRFGIQHEDFGPARRDEALRAQLLGPLRDDASARLLLVAGRLAVDKRQRWVVEAVRLAARDRPLALVVLGDGPERARLEQQARDLPHATFISFTRDRAEYAALLASVDALVHASPCETYGFVLAETLASGTPLVVPDVGGADALADASCAERYAAFSGPHEAAAAIARLLDRPREELRAGAVHAAAAQPSSARHYEELFALYARALARR
ncbi:MAG: glycosyltransferase [Polyangiaceae bacterium]|nr:glycosyltransferase [Polyangiaceae bacterium]